MKHFVKTRWWLLLALALWPGAGRASAQGTAFTYQGLLNTPTIPASGTYALQFTLYSVSTGGTPLAGPVTNSAVVFTNGFFSTLVNFGAGAFAGGSNWLDIAIQTNAGSAFLSLPPRQQITPVPYAVYATAAGTASLASNVAAGINISGVVVSNSVFLGNGAGLTNLNSTNLTGTVPQASLPAGVIQNNQSTEFTLNNDLRMASNPIYLRTGTDSNHGLGYFSTFAGVLLDGPALFGYSGGILGAVQSPTAQTCVLYWTAGGKVGIDKTNPATALDVNGTINGTAFTGNGAGLTNLAYASLVGAPVVPSTNGFVTAAVTNGLASTNFVLAQGFLTSANGGKAALATNVVAGIAITNAFITNSVFAGDGSGLTNLTFSGSQFVSIGNTNGGTGNFFAGTAGNPTQSGSDNTGLGQGALNNNTSGSANAAYGKSALKSNTTGSNNTALGYQAGFNITTGSSNIDIGNMGVSGDTNIIRIGTGQSATYLAGTVYADGGGLTNLNAAYLTGAIPAAVTNGLATTNFVLAQGFLTSANGGKAALATNVVAGIAITNAFITNSVFAGNGAGLTNVTVSASQLTSIGNSSGGTGNFFAGAAGNATQSGGLNTALGQNAMHSNGSGGDNAAFGQNALAANTTGSYNTASGMAALQSNTTGSGNTANGQAALPVNTSGANNTASGSIALDHNTTGGNNTASGFYALGGNTTGSYNTADGDYALANSTTGSNNIAEGYQAGINISTGSSNIDIGSPGLSTDTNIIRIGNGQTASYLSGTVYGDGGGLTNISYASLAGAPAIPATNGLASTNFVLSQGFLTTANGANAALASNVVAGIAITNATITGAIVQMAFNPIYLGNDQNHGLAYASSFGGGQVDGPALYGYTGGVLGTVQNSNQTGVLYWNASGQVGIDKTNPATALDVNGTVNATAFTGNGSGLTNLSASQFAGGVAGLLPAGVVTNGATGVAVTGAFAGNGAGLTNINLYNENSAGAINWTIGYTWQGLVLSSSPKVGSSPSGVVAADVNGDGKPDLISANAGADTLTVLTNSGSGVFGLSATLAVGSGPFALTAADVNGDGLMDLISANANGNSLTVLTNNGKSGFILSSTPGVGAGPNSVTAADVNGDGKLDLITANAGDNSVTVLTNNGRGGFVLQTNLFSYGQPSTTLAYVNRTGLPNLACLNYNGSVAVFTNDGGGNFTLSTTVTFGFPRGISWMVAADVNGDGLPDFITANSDYQSLSVLTNNGNGSFALSATYPLSSTPWSVSAADVNGDGLPDLISANNDGTLSVLTNNGSGGFALAFTPQAGLVPVSVAAADVNGDGWLDLISANQATNTLTVLTNFFQPTSYLASFSGKASLTNAFITNSVFAGNGAGLTNLNYNNIVNAPVIPSTNGLVTAAITNGLATVSYVQAQGFATAAVTNGLASTNFVLSQGYLTSNSLPGVANAALATNVVSGIAITNAFITNSSFAGNGAGLTNLTYANLVGAPPIPTTNGLVTAAVTNGLATTNFVLAQGFVSAAITNGLVTASYLAGQGYLTNANGGYALLASNVVSGISITNAFITNSVFAGNGAWLTNLAYASLVGAPAIPSTNGLATTNYVLAQGFVASSITNGLASTNFVLGQGYLTSANGGRAALATNVVSGIAITNAFITNSFFAGNGAGLTNLPYGNLVGAPVIPSTNGFVTVAVTNGLASTNFVLAQGYLTSANGGSALLASNVVSGISITNAFITNSSFAGNGAGLTNLTYANLVGAPLIPSTNGLASVGFVTSQGYLTNANGANAVLATNVVSGIAITNAFITNSILAGDGGGLTNISFSSLVGVPATLTTNGLVSPTVTNGLATTNFVLAQGFVTAAITNGLATTSYLNSQGFLTNANGGYAQVATNVVSGISITNAFITNSVFAGSGAGLTNLPYASLVGAPAIPSTNGLATTNYVFAQGFVTSAITNGLASTNFVLAQGYLTSANGGQAALATNVVSGIAITNAFITNSSFAGNGAGLTNLAYASLVGAPVIPSTNGFVTALVTNGLATTNFVLAQGFVTAAVTNGLASVSFVTGQGYLTSANGGKAALATNVVSGIAITNAFITNSSFAGNGAGLTNLAYASLVGAPVIPSTNGLVTATVTNGLATTNYVLAQGFVASSITNGLASTNFVLGQGYLTSANGGKAALATNVVSGIAITNAFITNSSFAGNGAGLTNLAYASLVGAPVIPSTNGFVTVAVTNGLASTNFVLAQGFLISANGANAALATNVVSGIAITNAFITNSTFAGDGAGLTNLSVNVSKLTGNLGLAQLPSGVLTNGGVVSGTFVGNGAGLTNLNLSTSQLPPTVLTNGAAGVILSGTFSGNFVGMSNTASLQSLGLGAAVTSATNYTTGFSVSSTVTVGSGPYSAVAVDVNGDGKLDLVSANAGSGTLTVLTNAGAGNFILASSPSVGSQPYSVVAADVNGDGKPDLISANVGSGTLTVLTNNGAGSFGSAATLTAGLQPLSVTAADVNADGKVDLIGANYGSGSVTVYTNNGSGAFTVASTIAALSSPAFVTAVTNLFGDGRVALICANAGSATLAVLTNSGGGNFGVGGSLLVGNDPQSVVAMDVNGDGKIDLISANAGDSTLTVLTNNGAGGFGLYALPGTGSAPESVVSADINHDGKMDLITANSGANTLTVLTNNGSGFGLYASVAVGSGPRAVMAADLNGDGNADLISANGSASSLTVVVNNWSANLNVNFVGTFTGSGAGLTAVPVSAIKGGISTNLSIGGHVFYITNGIIVNLQ